MEMVWEVYPQGIYDILDYVHGNYAFPALMVTENGAALNDLLDNNAQVDDPKHIQYLQALSLEAARSVGVDPSHQHRPEAHSP